MRMTPQRKQIINKIQDTPLFFGFTERGCEEYFYGDGSVPNQEVTKGLIEVGKLKKSESILGAGQVLVLVE